jgi:hypothetical protein
LRFFLCGKFYGLRGNGKNTVYIYFFYIHKNSSSLDAFNKVMLTSVFPYIVHTFGYKITRKNCLDGCPVPFASSIPTNLKEVQKCCWLCHDDGKGLK